MKKLILLFLFAFALTGCATRATVATYGPENNLLKTTTVKHSWWLGLPAFAPMDVRIVDGAFSVESKAADLGNIINIGSRD
jgi:uncharacterized protein YcfL